MIFGGLLSLSPWQGWPAVILIGAVVFVTAFIEPVYGKLVPRPPLSTDWPPTGEKFIDPASGKPVEVWFDPSTGARKYVDVGEKMR